MVIGAAGVAIAVLALAPQYALAALPVLIVLVCPLSMVLMMRKMRREQPQNSAIGQPARSEVDRNEEIARLREEIDALKREAADNGPTDPGEKPRRA